ncbi:MAG: DUF2330 domain-containing protein [Planctomycetota bacterium]|jgi:hypothetical protein
MNPARLGLALLLALVLLPWAAAPAETACCYFSAMEKDVNQPGQKAFLTWDPVEKVESFTVQPMFEGNAADFGMVVPTPTQPTLSEMHRDLFKSLAVFTILKPMNVKKFKPAGITRRLRGGVPTPSAPVEEQDSGVRVLESGVVGSLDYKIIEATRATGLYDWLKANGYHYAGDTATLDFYIQKRWFFTVMKIDPQQMRRNPDGTYRGEVTPTRFSFESDRLIYPLRITRISVPDKTDALFYVQAPEKMDLPGDFSHELSFQSMWTNAFSFANWEFCTDLEKSWWEHVKDERASIQEQINAWRQRNPRGTLTTLEWSRRLTADDLRVLSDPSLYDREAPEEDVRQLGILSGILEEGQYVTKCRHVFLREEMEEDLVFVEARFRGRVDSVEHIEILPTSPP